MRSHCGVSPEEKAALASRSELAPDLPENPPSATAEEVYAHCLIDSVDTALSELAELENSLVYLERQEAAVNKKRKNYAPWFVLIPRKQEIQAIALDAIRERLEELRDDLLERAGEET